MRQTESQRDRSYEGFLEIAGDDVVRILILGPQGSGEDTQPGSSPRVRIPHVATGTSARRGGGEAASWAHGLRRSSSAATSSRTT